MNDKVRILIISEAHIIKTFVQATVIKIKEETGAQFDCLLPMNTNRETVASLQKNFGHVYVNDFPKGFLKHMPKVRFFQMLYGLMKLAKSIKEYDAIHIHYHYYYYTYFIPVIRKKASKIFLSFLGCDFNQVGKFYHWHNQKTVNLIDGVFATNEAFLKKIILKYDISNNTKQTGILMPLIDCFISFEKFLIENTADSAKQLWQTGKKVIVCGYNAALIMQHALIINALIHVKDKLSDCKVIFPMTYGWNPDEIRCKVKEGLRSTFIDSLILEDFLTIEKLQALRLAADIFINIPSRDQMASSMLEHLAAGSVVITGKWLPYESLVDKGIYFISIETPYDLPDALLYVLENLEELKCKANVNREIILNMMSWEKIKTNWYKYYELAEN